MTVGQVTVPYVNGYDFGVGADLASGSPMGKVVEGQESGVPHALGATASFDVRRIHSTRELEQKLGIDVEASLGCATFGAGISARFGFAKDAKVQSSSLFLTVIANVEFEFLSIDEPILTHDAAGLVDQQKAFEARYGNAFVRGVGRGGMFVGLIQIDTESSDESTKIAAELEGSYGAFHGDAKTTFENLTKETRSEIHVTAYHEGGPIDLVPTDISDPTQLYDLMVKFLTSLKDHPDDNAKPYYVTLAPIAIAGGPLPPDAMQLQHAQDVLVFCATQRSRALDSLNLLQFIIDNQSKYDFRAPTTLERVRGAWAGYQSDLDLIARCGTHAVSDVTNAVMPVEFAQGEGAQYPQGSMPDPMPTPKAGTTVAVPDFSSAGSWIDVDSVAAQHHLKALHTDAPDTSAGPFKVLSQDRAAGDVVPEGSTITIVAHPLIAAPATGGQLTAVPVSGDTLVTATDPGITLSGQHHPHLPHP